MTHYIFSTLSCSQKYTKYHHGGGDLPIIGESILIKGGANIADRNIHTPRGVMTAISDEEYAELENNPMFQTHKRNGYISVEKIDRDIEKAVAELSGRDECAPLTMADFAEGKAPVEAPHPTPAGKRGARR